MPEQRFAALDTTFLIKLRDGNEDAQEVFDWLNANWLFPVVTETVVQELMDMSIEDPDGEVCEIARETLSCIPVWGCLAPSMADINRDIARITALVKVV